MQQQIDTTNAKPVYDHSKVMKLAWKEYRENFFGKTGRNIFRAALRSAWSQIKYAAYLDQCSEEQNRIRYAIAAIENKNFLTAQDHKDISELRAEFSRVASC